MNETKPITMLRKAFIFIFLFIAVLTITACAGGTQNPTGSISNDIFINIDNFEITELQLWEALRPNAPSVLRIMIDRELFADEIGAIDLRILDESDEAFESAQRQRTRIQSSINEAVFGQTTVAGIVNMNAQFRARQVLQFVDTFAVSTPDVNFDDVIAGIEELIIRWTSDLADDDVDTDDDNYDFGWLEDARFAPLVEEFKLSLAQFNFAREILLELVEDEQDNQYISELDLVNIFRTHFENRHDVSAFIVQFQSEAEHQLARQRWQVKPNARGEWFQLPDIFSQAGFEAVLAANPANATADGYAYARQLLDELNVRFEILDNTVDPAVTRPVTFDEFYEQINFTTTIYQDFYNRWILSRNRVTNRELPLDDQQVLNLFMAIYDDLVGVRRFTTIVEGNWTVASITPNYSMEELMAMDEFRFNFDTPILSNTALRNEVYNLAGNTFEDSEGIRYSRTPTNLGGTAFFLIFGLWADPVSQMELVDDSDEDNIQFNTEAVDEDGNPDEAVREAAEAAREEAWDFLFNQRLSRTFINAQVNERFEEAEINIYDSIIRLFYNHENGSDFGGRSTSNDYVASVNGTNILVDDLFDNLVYLFGISTAFDTILVEILAEVYEDQITDDEIAAMKVQFNATLTSFRNNGLAGSGFPASLGMADFLMLAFQANNNHEAFRTAHIVPRLRQLFSQDWVNQYGANTLDSNIFNMFAELSEIQYNENYGITTSHVLIYIDLNNTGSPTNPDDLTLDDFVNLGFLTRDEASTLSPEDARTTADARMEAMADRLRIEVSRQASLLGPINARTLQTVIDVYQRATRFGDVNFSQNAPENADGINDFNRWTEFRRAGFGLRMEELGQISNITNNPDTQGGFDVRFYNHAMTIAEALFQILGNDPTAAERSAILPLWTPNGIPREDGQLGFEFRINDVRSDFGWHLLLVTDTLSRLSALNEYRVDADNQPILEDRFVSSVKNPWTDEYLNSYNFNRWLTADQIMIFIEESKLETGVESLNTAMINAINRYFTPIRNLYQSSNNQFELAFRLLAKTQSPDNFGLMPNLGSESLNARMTLLRDVNLRAMFNYGLFFNHDGTQMTFAADSTSLFALATVPRYASLFGNWFVILNELA